MPEQAEQTAPRTAVSRRAKICFALFTAGFILLANPIVGCTDLLPDPIGWLLIWFALGRYTGRSDPMRDARKWALINAAIGLLRLGFQFAFPASGIPSNLLMATAVTALLDIGGMCMFFFRFFKGFEELSKYAADEKLYVRSDNYRFLSFLFSILRAVFMVLPELTALASLFVSQYGPGDLTGFSDPEKAFLVLEQIGGSRTLFAGIFVILTVIAAVVWLVQFLPGLRSFTSDAGIAAHLEEPLSEEEAEAVRYERTGIGYLRIAKFVAGLAALCCLDLGLDGVRFMPFGLFPALMVAVCLLLDRFRAAQHTPLLFRKDLIPFAAASALLIGFEFFRRFATVWDARAIEETEFWQLFASAGWMLLSGAVLFFAWIRFALHANELSAPYRVGLLYLNGLPFYFLAVIYALQTVVCILPALSRILLLPRILLIAFFTFVVFRRFSALEERIRQRLSEEPAEPHPGRSEST